MTLNIIAELLKPISEGRNLSLDQATRIFQIIMNGGATPAQMGAFLMGLRIKGESVDEIAAGATVLRLKAPRVNAPAGTIDVCGTGGDGAHSLNISTAVAFVVAACGVPVAKHGNKAVSSKSGSADVLAELSVNIQGDAALAERCLAQANICFMLAPLYHHAMRHVAPVRQELGMRTIFNLLGPLSNPAQPEFQLLGVYGREWLVPMAEALHRLGVKRALVVHGAEGLDELSIRGESYVAELNEGEINEYILSPEVCGLTPNPGSLQGGDAAHNAKALRELLLGMKSAYRDAVIFNAAAALVIAQKADDIASGAQLAADAIDSGNAYKVLQKLIDVSRT